MEEEPRTKAPVLLMPFEPESDAAPDAELLREDATDELTTLVEAEASMVRLLVLTRDEGRFVCP
jgi:hypothetical protein